MSRYAMRTNAAPRRGSTRLGHVTGTSTTAVIDLVRARHTQTRGSARRYYGLVAQWDQPSTQNATE
jgi:hypothetical protein